MQALAPARREAPAQLPLGAPGIAHALLHAPLLAPAAQGPWTRADLAGRLAELSAAGAPASLTLALGLVADAQREGETCAWISARESSFFPPDAAAGGVDLDALVVVRAPGAQAAARAADKLVRSGGFGLVAMDLGDGGAADRGLTPALQGRLQGLAQKHGTALLCLTEKKAEAPSLGSLVSLRVEARRRRAPGPGNEGRFLCELRALKDKRRAPGWTQAEAVRGPAGLR
jgi:recombination protein RecA